MQVLRKIQTTPNTPLQIVLSMCAENGSPLQLALDLHRLQELQVFLQFIFYTELLLGFYSIQFTEAVIFTDLMQKDQNRFFFFLKCLNWFFILSLTFLLGLLNMLHWGILVLSNKSTIEFCESKKSKDKYDLGRLNNLV